MTSEFPAIAPSRPLWLMTLADLALLLVGFFVLVQASANLDRKALAAGIRHGFGVGAAPAAAPSPATVEEPMPVAVAGMMNFAVGSATLPGSSAGLVAWAREVGRDPRVTLRVAGMTDGSTADVDPVTGSAAVLAADRARAVAVALANAQILPADRMTIVNETRSGRRAVLVTLGFAGPESHNRLSR